MMFTDNNIWQLAEDYVSGQLSKEQMLDIDRRVKENPAFASSFQECVSLLSAMVDSGRQEQFRSVLDEISAGYMNVNVDDEAYAQPAAKTISLRSHYWRTAGVAAAIAIICSVGFSLFMHQRSLKTASFYQELARHQRDIASIKHKQAQQDIAINKIQDSLKTGAPARDVFSTGSGFALTNDGYLATNYHVVNGADSVYIRTAKGDYYKAYTAAFNEQTDIAILKIEARNFRFSRYDLPYKLNTQASHLAERVYTLGYPSDQLTYSEGYLRAQTGYQGNADQYLLELPADPGQSGAPVIDASGNIVGIVTANETDRSSTTYAVGAQSLLQLIHAMPTQMNLRQPQKTRLNRLPREQQVEKLKDFTCMVQVYKN